jgi:hypothetical protein
MRPLLDRRGKRIVHGFFGKIEVAEKANERREHTPRVGAVDSTHHLPRSLVWTVVHIVHGRYRTGLPIGHYC